MMYGKSRNHGIELAFLERKRRSVTLPKHHVLQSCFSTSLPRLIEHCRGRVKRDDGSCKASDGSGNDARAAGQVEYRARLLAQRFMEALLDTDIGFGSVSVERVGLPIELVLYALQLIQWFLRTVSE